MKHILGKWNSVALSFFQVGVCSAGWLSVCLPQQGCVQVQLELAVLGSSCLLPQRARVPLLAAPASQILNMSLITIACESSGDGWLH